MCNYTSVISFAETCSVNGRSPFPELVFCYSFAKDINRLKDTKFYE